MAKLHGHGAIAYAMRTGAALNRYNTPIEDARENITVEEARTLAEQDPGLIWCEATVYSITNAVSGADLGEYDADSEDAALDAMARDAGYASFAASCAAIGQTEDDARRELRVDLRST